jgi:hypothetical protein
LRAAPNADAELIAKAEALADNADAIQTAMSLYVIGPVPFDVTWCKLPDRFPEYPNTPVLKVKERGENGEVFAMAFTTPDALASIGGALMVLSLHRHLEEEEEKGEPRH